MLVRLLGHLESNFKCQRSHGENAECPTLTAPIKIVAITLIEILLYLSLSIFSLASKIV